METESAKSVVLAMASSESNDWFQRDVQISWQQRSSGLGMDLSIDETRHGALFRWLQTPNGRYPLAFGRPLSFGLVSSQVLVANLELTPRAS